LTILRDLLGDRYVFHEGNRLDSWNENELELKAKRKITLPMADTIPRSLLAALEHTFGPKTKHTTRANASIRGMKTS
jgi:hypothetical protein